MVWHDSGLMMNWCRISRRLTSRTVGPTTPITGEGLSGCPTEDNATGRWQIGGGSRQGGNQEEEIRGGRTGGQGRVGVDRGVVCGGTACDARHGENGRPNNV